MARRVSAGRRVASDGIVDMMRNRKQRGRGMVLRRKGDPKGVNYVVVEHDGDQFLIRRMEEMAFDPFPLEISDLSEDEWTVVAPATTIAKRRQSRRRTASDYWADETAGMDPYDNRHFDDGAEDGPQSEDDDDWDSGVSVVEQARSRGREGRRRIAKKSYCANCGGVHPYTVDKFGDWECRNCKEVIECVDCGSTMSDDHVCGGDY